MLAIVITSLEEQSGGNVTTDCIKANLQVNTCYCENEWKKLYIILIFFTLEAAQYDHGYFYQSTQATK